MNGLIEIGDKVVLYGFFNGFTYETDGATNGLVALETGERVEIPLGGIMKKDQIITKKDVISRMKQLFPNNRIDWINGILHEFGDEFGLWKYKAGYEQGKLEGAIKREKVVVPQFVADWIKYCKFTNVDLQYALIVGDVYFYNYANQKDFSKLKEFLETENNQELFARAWLDGYTVEKEKRYRVKAKGVYHHSSVLKLDSITGRWFFGSEKYMCGSLEKHTRKELEDAGFGEVFNSPLFEVEEVE